MVTPANPLRGNNQPITVQAGVPPATVVFGNVSSKGDKAQVVPDKSIWVQYIIVNRFEKDRHTYMMGITAPNGISSNQGGSVAFVRLASSTLLWICDWTIKRERLQPVAPDPTPVDPNWILLDDWWEPYVVELGGDGQTPIYRLSGTFFYGHRDPNERTIRNINYPRSPFVVDAFDRTIVDGDLAQNLSNIFSSAGGNNATIVPPK